MRFKSLLVIFALIFGLSSSAFSSPLDGCLLQNKRDKKSHGRFIWKATGAHYPRNAVVVAPSYYFLQDVSVDLFGASITEAGELEVGGSKLGTARIKSTGNCAGHPECLFAATYLVPHNGAYYQRRFGSLVVRIRPDNKNSKKECRYYVVKRPSGRAEFRG